MRDDDSGLHAFLLVDFWRWYCECGCRGRVPGEYFSVQANASMHWHHLHDHAAVLPRIRVFNEATKKACEYTITRARNGAPRLRLALRHYLRSRPTVFETKCP